MTTNHDDAAFWSIGGQGFPLLDEQRLLRRLGQRLSPDVKPE